MHLSYLFVEWATTLSTIIRIISCIILAMFVIPLQWKEVAVKNGLRKLRLLLLIAGLLIFFVNSYTLYFLFDAIVNEIRQRPLNSSLQFGNAIAFLALSVILLLMYSTQYTTEQKDLHKRIGIMEDADEAREKKRAKKNKS